MFQSFDQLNAAVKGFSDTQARFKVDQLINQIDSLRSLVNQIAGEYARTYSQVQWMKYNDDGDPTDVTPDQQTSVPKSVIAKAKATLAKAQTIIGSLPTGNTTSMVLNPLRGYFTWIDGHNGYFNDLGVFIDGTPTGPAYKCMDFYQTAVANGNYTFTLVRGNTTIIKSITSGHRFYLETYNMLSGPVGRVVFKVYDRDSSDTKLLLALSNSGQVTAVVYEAGDMTQISGTMSGAAVSGMTFLDKLRFIISRTDFGSGNSLTIPDDNFFGVGSDIVDVQTAASEVTLTYPTIDVTTLINGYDNLVAAINGLIS